LQAYLARQRDFPLICCELERHVQADQIFIAMQEQQSLVIVSSQERPTHEGLRAFVTEKGQSFLIKKGVWHHGLICLAAQALYLVIEGGDYANDCHFCSLDERYTIYQDNHEAGNVVKLPS
jgi:ureidoglycolate lyase